MKTYLTLILLLLLVSVFNVSAQPIGEGNAAEDDAVESTTGVPLKFLGAYTVVQDKTYATDALDLEVAFYLFNDITLAIPPWDEIILSVGPSAAVRVNSGIFDNQSYSEQIMLYSFGVASRWDFPESHIFLDINYGQHFSYYTLQSGYEVTKKDNFLSGKIVYLQDGRRMADEALFPTWGLAFAGGSPYSDQKIFDWGYHEFQARQNEAGQNLSSIHATAELGLFDLIMGETFKVGVSARAGGGKYNANIIYWQLGAGVKFLFDNAPAVFITADKIWGFDNSKANNWYFTIGLDYALFQKL